jgi:hypothetical protein
MAIHPSTRLMKIPNVPQTIAQEIKFKKNAEQNYT